VHLMMHDEHLMHLRHD